VRLYPLNVDDGKTEIMAALALPGPGPGAFHFPTHLDTVGEEFFAQLCAEHRETRYNKGGVATHEVWVLDRERNEVLDCAVIALAMFRLANPNLRDQAERVRQQAATPQARPLAVPAETPYTPARDPWLPPTHGAGWLTPRRRWL
jgi:phage terminase large subunit GpA-like protein